MVSGNYSLISPPDNEPITLAEAKKHLNVEVDFEEHDAYISSLITVARQFTEDYTGNIFCHQLWKCAFDCFPYEITLRRRPVTDINSISYIDDTGARVVIDPALYQTDLDGFLARIRPAYGLSWPHARYQMNAVEVAFSVGAEDTQRGIPAQWKQGLLLLIGHLFENRENTIVGVSVAQLPLGYDALVGLDRIINV